MPRSWRSASNAIWQLPPGCSPISGRSTDVAGGDRRGGVPAGEMKEERVGAQQAVLDAVELVAGPAPMTKARSSSPACSGAMISSRLLYSMQRMSNSGDSPRIVPTTAGRIFTDTLWNEPIASRPPPARSVSMSRSASTQLLEHGGGVHEQRRADRGQLDAPRPAGAVEHLVAEHPFQPGDLLTDPPTG